MCASGKAYGSPPISTSSVRTTESVSGSCSWKRVPLPGCERDAHRAAHLLDHVLHHVEADAAAGDLGDRLLHREAGQEQELEQLGFARACAAVSALVRLPLDDGRAQLARGRCRGRRRDTVIMQHAGAVARLEAHDAFGGLAGARRSSGDSMP